MYFYSFVALAFVSWAHSYPVADDGDSALLPINGTMWPFTKRDFEGATDLHSRAVEDFSHLSPQDQQRFIFGRYQEDGKIILADLLLHASDGLNIVSMERFEPLTASVDCKGDDGAMSLTFKSEDAFKHALKEWSYINEAAKNRFLLIANHDGCGETDQRQPYL